MRVNLKLKEAWNFPSADQDLCNEFTIEEIMSAIKTLKSGKAPGPDNLHQKFFSPSERLLSRMAQATPFVPPAIKRIPKDLED